MEKGRGGGREGVFLFCDFSWFKESWVFLRIKVGIRKFDFGFNFVIKIKFFVEYFFIYIIERIMVFMSC